MPLPANELEQVQAISDKIAVGLMSVTSAMNELGVEDPEAEIAKIIEEKVEFDKKLNLEQVNNGKENE
jgi:cysteine sulfinate desulfinase/cysteine desulfurase-like protein